MPELPDYDDLPAASVGGRSGWGLFGAEDGAGLLNLQDPEQVLTAARLVKTGKVFPLDAAVDAFDPPLASSRGTPRHSLVHRAGTLGFDEVIDNFYPQGSSQWDSLAHVAYEPDQFYNGASAADILAKRRAGIDVWARKGIAGRAVLLDLYRSRADRGDPYDPGASVAFGVDDLEAARTRAGLEYRPGDVILLHTGFAAWYAGLGEADQSALPRQMRAPGVDHTEDVARYLWNSHASAVASDTYAVEVWPPDFSPEAQPFGFLHRMLIGQFGLALGELWWLRDLADDSAVDEVYEMFLVSAPLHLRGGIGSPANAIAIK